jgi:L-fucose isomerase-like protein
MAILGVFDEGCMGMYNAIFDDEHLNPAGIYKERLSQSALVAEMRRVTDAEASAAYAWLEGRGMQFRLGSDGATELTRDQVLDQLRLYIAAVRIADQFGCDAIGIQYQQGLKDMAPASDLAEGLLNDGDRPPVLALGEQRELYPGRPVIHFNEVDEGSAVDALVTNRVWTALGLDPATTLHDVRWGAPFGDDYVWVFEISGAVPPAHLVGGYAGAVSERQPPVYFGLGGGTIKGVSRPGEIVWSRVFLMDGRLHADLGRATVVELPAAETERRWQSTTPQWPIMHAVLHGVTRDQMMARHRSNHIQVAYGADGASADAALATKAAMFEAMGLAVHLCGDVAVA